MNIQMNEFHHICIRDNVNPNPYPNGFGFLALGVTSLASENKKSTNQCSFERKTNRQNKNKYNYNNIFNKIKD
jgi:hypothetical protein